MVSGFLFEEGRTFERGRVRKRHVRETTRMCLLCKGRKNLGKKQKKKTLDRKRRRVA
jgi:hypothetical protein